MSLKIINEHNNTVCDVIDIHPECTYNGILAVHKFGDHYNGISCFSSTSINTNYTYTSDQLKQFNNKQSVSRRIRKTLIEKQILLEGIRQTMLNLPS